MGSLIPLEMLDCNYRPILLCVLQPIVGKVNVYTHSINDSINEKEFNHCMIIQSMYEDSINVWRFNQCMTIQ